MTLSFLFPFVYALINDPHILVVNSSNEKFKLLKSILINSIRSRFNYVLTNKLFLAATFLDFNFKKFEFVKSSEARSNYIENAKLFIINLYSSYFINNKENIISPINTQIIQNEFETAYEKQPDAQLPNLNFNLDQSEVDNESQNETCVPSQIVIQKSNQSDENLPSCSYNILNENNNRKRKKIGGILNYIKDSKSTQFAN